METQTDMQLGIANTWPQTWDGTLEVLVKYLVSSFVKGKLMN